MEAAGVPSYISMYGYVPDTLAESPPVVVAAHFCNGSASQLFGYAGMSDLVAAADSHGFILSFPQFGLQLQGSWRQRLARRGAR